MDSLKKFIKKTKLDLILILTASFAIRLYHLDFLSLWRDEAFSVNVAKFQLADLLRATALDTQPPLHLVTLHFWIKAFGDSEYSVRSLSLIFGLITVFFIYQIGCLVFTSRKYATLLTVFAAINPLLILYSQEARAYSMLTAFTSAVLYFYLLFRKKPGFINAAGLIMFSILGLYSHYIFIVVLGTLFIIEAVRLIANYRNVLKIIKSKEAQIFAVIYILIAIAYIPWLIVFIRQLGTVGSNGFWLQFNPIQDIIVNIPRFFTAEIYPEVYILVQKIVVGYIIAFGVIFMILGTIQELKEVKKRFPIFSAMTYTMLGLVFVISFKFPFFYIRYLIFVTPAIIVLCVKGVMFIRKSIGRIATSVLVLLFVISSLYLYLFVLAQNFDAKEDYKDVAAYVTYNPDTDIILHGDALTIHGFKYYSTAKSYVYNKPENLPFYEGLAALNKDDYYTGPLNQYRWIWYIHLGDDSNISQKFSSQGFILEFSKHFAGNVSVDLFVR